MDISIFINLKKKHAAEVLHDILKSNKIANFFLLDELVRDTEFEDLGVSKEIFINKCQYAVVIGGDGTFIAASHLFIDQDIPLLGINVGNFGFLTEVKKEELNENINNLYNEKIHIEERLILDIELIRQHKCIEKFKAVNEAVISKGGLTKVVRLKAYVDNQYIGTFSGDGVMVSTPTGSTGYSLSAKGPIIFPTMNALIFNTICPHTLVFRPIIIPSKSKFIIENISNFKDMILTIDGFKGIKLEQDDKISIKRYDKNLKLITSSNRNFFDILREKFNWVE